MRKGMLIGVIILLIIGGAMYGRYRRSLNAGPNPQPQNTSEVYSQSGDVTSVTPTQLTISYTISTDINGVQSPVNASQVFLLNETTPVTRSVLDGEWYVDVPASISDIRIGIPVVVYLSQPAQDGGPPLVAQRVDILKQ